MRKSDELDGTANHDPGSIVILESMDLTRNLGHAVHSVSRGDAWYMFAGHRVHDAPSFAAKVPRSQIVQLVDPGGAIEPTGHSTQDTSPFLLIPFFLPASQGVQNMRRISRTFPGGHALHDEELSTRPVTVFIGHLLHTV